VSEHPLEPIFHPRGVALVGVPSGGASMSGGFLAALLEQGYQERGGLYPVNPKMEEVQGLRCYPTLLDTPDPVDHVISLVPARVVPGLVDQVIAKKARSIHFFTAGFSETGDEEMATLERDMVARLTGAGVRVIGPNCMGLYVPGVGLSFMQGFPKEPGNVMLVSQSGANAGDVVHGLGRRGVRFSKGISFGNGADLRAHHFFD
jgi:acyl-CoA synthetase (NDP forming)